MYSKQTTIIGDRDMISRYKRTGKDGKALHRVVIEKHIERELKTNEQVHHINGDRYDNRLENLAIVSSQAHNFIHNQRNNYTKKCIVCGVTYAPKPTKRKRSVTCSNKCKIKLDKINASKRKKPVLQSQKNGEHVKRWDSARDVQNELGYHESNINKCCNGKALSAYGYKWSYV